MHQHLHYGVPGGEERKKRFEKKIFEEKIDENFLNMKENSQPCAGSTESSRQDKPKEKHIETHSNLIDRN